MTGEHCREDSNGICKVTTGISVLLSRERNWKEPRILEPTSYLPYLQGFARCSGERITGSV